MTKVTNLLSVNARDLSSFKLPKWLLPEKIETLILGSVSSSSESESESDEQSDNSDGK